MTTDNDKVIDRKHIVADDHGVKVEINDDATIKNTTVDTNDDGVYDNKDSSTEITVTPKFDSKETKTCTDITRTADGKTFTANDIIRMQQKLAGRRVEYVYDATADVNVNGIVNSDDIIRMQQYLAGRNVKIGTHG